MNETKHTLTHGGTAVFWGLIGTIASFMPQIEQALRVILLIITIIATLLSIRKLMRGKSGDDDRASIPLVVGVLALGLMLLFLPGCEPKPAVDTPWQATSVQSHDGRWYVVVRFVPDVPKGSVSDVELWQRVGEVGSGLPVYTRRLQSASDASAPIFTKAGVLK